MPLQRRQDDIAELLGDGMAFGQLLVVLGSSRLVACSYSAVDPLRLIEHLPCVKKSVRALNPRIERLSPAGTPPSPAWMLMPVTLRSTSLSVFAPCDSIT